MFTECPCPMSTNQPSGNKKKRKKFTEKIDRKKMKLLAGASNAFYLIIQYYCFV